MRPPRRRRTRPSGGRSGRQNQFTTSPAGTIDLLVYHARDYRDIQGEPLDDPNRHTRIQPFSWNADGTPNFGNPVANGPLLIETPRE